MNANNFNFKNYSDEFKKALDLVDQNQVDEKLLGFDEGEFLEKVPNEDIENIFQWLKSFHH